MPEDAQGQDARVLGDAHARAAQEAPVRDVHQESTAELVVAAVLVVCLVVVPVAGLGIGLYAWFYGG